MTQETYHHQGENLPPRTQHDQQTISGTHLTTYWQSNLRLLAKLLCVWFFVSFGCGIIFADWLDQFTFFGFKLGFWFAQQGAIYAFVALIFIYAWRMKILERKYGIGDDEENSQ